MKKITINTPFDLVCGERLTKLEIAYSTYGELNAEKSNVIWVCHALSGNSEVHDWWAGVFGEGKALDPTNYFIVCANALGSCYGSTGPSHANVASYQKGIQFPLITVEDMVKSHQLLADVLGIQSIHTLIGPSLGGQQAVEWAAQEPNRFENLVLIATNAQHSPWGIAFNESQRLALLTDETFRANLQGGGKFGLKTARSIAMLSYRSYDGYGIPQKEDFPYKCDKFRSASYQEYQGDKFVKRFDAYAYWTLTKAMDSHNVGRGKGGVIAALERILARTLVLGVDSDLLFPIHEQAFLAEHIPTSFFETITSHYGHDGFLTETALVDKLIFDFLENDFANHKKTIFKRSAVTV